MRQMFRFPRADRRRLIVSSALAGALVAVIVAWLAYDATAASSDVSGARRPVILVAGICSQNPAESMSEIYQWLQDDLDYSRDEIILFDYRDTTPLSSPLDAYDEVSTLVSIDGAGGSASNLRGLIDSQVASGEQVDIIAHSQGGVVSLYAALDFAGQGGPSVAGKIHSIVTVESPVQGISELVFSTADLFNFIGWSCASSISPSVIDMHPEEPFDSSHVINMIVARNWASTPNPYIINVANTEDIIISNGLTPDGERGFLFTAHEWIHQDLGATLNPADAHTLPLEIISNSAAVPVRDRLLRALVEYQLQSLFLAGDSGLNPALAPASLEVSFGQTRAFLGNQHSGIHPAFVEPPIQPAPLTDVFLSGGDAGMKQPLMAPAITAPCTLDVELSFADGVTTWTFVVGATQPSTWSTSVILLGNEIPLWSIALPTLPPITISFSFPIPPIGEIEVQSTLTVEGGGCSASDAVDTGVTPVTVVSDIVNFTLENMTIEVGTTVAWVNRDTVRHTSTSGVSPTGDGTWDSLDLNPNQQFSFTFDEVGEFPYFCTLHPTIMTATVTVIQ